METQGKVFEILLVEDSPADRLITTEALGQQKFPKRVHAVEDGLEAMAYLRQEGKYSHATMPDLILLDLNMPRMDGRQVLVEIKSDPIFKFIPVIVFSSSDADEDVLFAYGHYANGYVSKPVDFSKMSDIVSVLEDFWFRVASIPDTGARLGEDGQHVAENVQADKKVIRILLLEEIDYYVKVVEHMLEQADVHFDLHVCGTLNDAEKLIMAGKFDVLVTDLSLPDSDGIHTLKRLKLAVGQTPIIVLTDTSVQQQGVDAIKLGAADFVLKDSLKTRNLVDAILHAIEHNRIQGELDRSRQLEVMGQLSAGIAHEFNNLLTVIQGYSGILLEHADSDDIREPAQLIEKATMKASSLTRQLLSITRKQSLSFEYREINQLSSELSGVIESLVGDDIAIEYRLSQADMVSKVDVMLFEQILTNLAINARDAMPGGGKLAIVTRQVKVVEADTVNNPGAYAGQFAMLEVIDTGTGIPDDIVDKIFDPFFTTKDMTKGTGLGLATVLSLVQQHKGWLQVETRLGAGTCFRIFFPLHQASGTAMPLERRQVSRFPATGKNETILVVDDKSTLREMSKKILESNGFRVLESESGSGALELWRQNRDDIDLVFTDFSMPGSMSGLDLANELKRQAPNLPVIMASGFIDDQNEIDKNYVFLPKPFNTQLLLKAISDCLADESNLPGGGNG